MSEQVVKELAALWKYHARAADELGKTGKWDRSAYHATIANGLNQQSQNIPALRQAIAGANTAPPAGA